MAGDSHVAGKIYPEQVGEIILEKFPDTEFSHWGKNGAGFYTYNDTPEFMYYIFEAQPDILIVHLGTNDCYTGLNPDKMTEDMQIFYDNVRQKLPECSIVYVTPFENKRHDKISGKKKKAQKFGPWYINPYNKECAQVISDFANSHENTYVIDNYSEAGDMFLTQQGLIRPDFVHLTVEGYQILGRQVADKLLQFNSLFPESSANNVHDLFDPAEDPEIHQ